MRTRTHVHTHTRTHTQHTYTHAHTHTHRSWCQSWKKQSRISVCCVKSSPLQRCVTWPCDMTPSWRLIYIFNSLTYSELYHMKTSRHMWVSVCCMESSPLQRYVTWPCDMTNSYIQNTATWMIHVTYGSLFAAWEVLSCVMCPCGVPYILPKEPYILRKRALHSTKRSPTFYEKEPYILPTWRDAFMH